MAHETMRACRIEQVGKQRNGRPRYWCSVHKASATGTHGIRLDVCELAYRSAEHTHLFDLDFRNWPGGVAMWGAVAPVFDTTPYATAVGVHLHARRVAGADKEIDGTYDAIRIKNRRTLLDEDDILLTSETAVNYYLSKFVGVDISHLFCIRCGEPHLDAGYYAITPHRNHLCHGCGHIFRDSTKSVSNPIVLLHERPDIPHPHHEIIRAPKKLDIKQADCPGGIQIWASNPAFIWTAARTEESGLHVHAFDADGEELCNDTYAEVKIDGILLDENHIRYFMAQNALPSFKGRIVTLRCPSCSTPHFSPDSALSLRSEFQCAECGTTFKNTGKKRLVATNPFVEVREQLAAGRFVEIRRPK